MLNINKCLILMSFLFLYGCLGGTTSNNLSNNNSYKITETKAAIIKDYYCKKNDGVIYKTNNKKCSYGDRETIVAEYNLYIKNKNKTLVAEKKQNILPENGLACVNQKFSNGNYIGQIYLNKNHGYGLTSWENSSHRYLGLYNNGLREGLGIYFFSPNEYYYGNFKDGERHGKGVYLVNNVIYEGLWNKSNFEKEQILDKRNLLIQVLDAAKKAKSYC